MNIFVASSGKIKSLGALEIEPLFEMKFVAI